MSRLSFYDTRDWYECWGSSIRSLVSPPPSAEAPTGSPWMTKAKPSPPCTAQDLCRSREKYRSTCSVHSTDWSEICQLNTVSKPVNYAIVLYAIVLACKKRRAWGGVANNYILPTRGHAVAVVDRAPTNEETHHWNTWIIPNRTSFGWMRWGKSQFRIAPLCGGNCCINVKF